MQAELVAAVSGRAPAPAGFDAGSIRAAAASLAAKRRRSVARAWPVLPEVLGDGFAERFDAFASQSPLPRIGGPLADGRAFLRWLAVTGEAPEAFVLPALAVDLRYVQTADGLRPRRGPMLKAAVIHEPRRLVMAIRLPGLREWWLSLRF